MSYVSSDVLGEGVGLIVDGKVLEGTATLILAAVEESGVGLIDCSNEIQRSLNHLKLNPYGALEMDVGVATDGVDPSLVKKQYRKLALRYHPDKTHNRTGELFAIIHSAYNTLCSNPPPPSKIERRHTDSSAMPRPTQVPKRTSHNGRPTVIPTTDPSSVNEWMWGGMPTPEKPMHYSQSFHSFPSTHSSDQPPSSAHHPRPFPTEAGSSESSQNPSTQPPATSTPRHGEGNTQQRAIPKPAAPFRIHVVKSDTHSLTLQWHHFNGTATPDLEIFFELEWRIAGETEWRRPEKLLRSKSCMKKNLHPNRSYQFRVRAKRASEWSSFSEPLTASTDMVHKRRKSKSTPAIHTPQEDTPTQLPSQQADESSTSSSTLSPSRKKKERRQSGGGRRSGVDGVVEGQLPNPIRESPPKPPKASSPRSRHSHRHSHQSTHKSSSSSDAPDILLPPPRNHSSGSTHSSSTLEESRGGSGKRTHTPRHHHKHATSSNPSSSSTSSSTHSQRRRSSGSNRSDMDTERRESSKHEPSSSASSSRDGDAWHCAVCEETNSAGSSHCKLCNVRRSYASKLNSTDGSKPKAEPPSQPPAPTSSTSSTSSKSNKATASAPSSSSRTTPRSSSQPSIPTPRASSSSSSSTHQSKSRRVPTQQEAVDRYAKALRKLTKQRPDVDGFTASSAANNSTSVAQGKSQTTATQSSSAAPPRDERVESKENISNQQQPAPITPTHSLHSISSDSSPEVVSPPTKAVVSPECDDGDESEERSDERRPSRKEAIPSVEDVVQWLDELYGCAWDQGRPCLAQLKRAVESGGEVSGQAKCLALAALGHSLVAGRCPLNWWENEDSLQADQRKKRRRALADQLFDDVDTLELAKLAEGGSVHAQFHLAYMLQWGKGKLRQSLPQAVYWYRRASDQGHANAGCNLGVCYYYGQGVTKNEATAAHYFQLAAIRGHAKAQCNLGVCYRKGKGVEKDLHQAALWYEISATQGDKDAREALAILKETEKLEAGKMKDKRAALAAQKKATRIPDPAGSGGL